MDEERGGKWPYDWHGFWTVDWGDGTMTRGYKAPPERPRPKLRLIQGGKA
jgi:hypothetical protein